MSTVSDMPRCRRGLAHRTRCTLGAPDNLDKAPAWRALGRIHREQLLGQQFQRLACVATPHQGDQGHDVCTKAFWCMVHRQVIKVPVPCVANSQHPSMLSTNGRIGPVMSLRR